MHRCQRPLWRSNPARNWQRSYPAEKGKKVNGVIWSLGTCLKKNCKRHDFHTTLETSNNFGDENNYEGIFVNSLPLSLNQLFKCIWSIGYLLCGGPALLFTAITTHLSVILLHSSMMLPLELKMQIHPLLNGQMSDLHNSPTRNIDTNLERSNQSNRLHCVIDPKIHASIQSNANDWRPKTPVQAYNSITWQGFSVYI